MILEALKYIFTARVKGRFKNMQGTWQNDLFNSAKKTPPFRRSTTILFLLLIFKISYRI